jgi:Tol biopolymer transport system component
LIPDAFDPAISPDGMRIAFAHRDEGGFARIAVAELDNPAGHTVLTRNDDGLWDHYRPAWSPDGKTICYSDFRDLWVVPAAGGEAERLTVEHGTDRDAVWSPDGSHVYFSSMRESTIILWRVHVKSGRAERVTQGAGPASQPSLSTDGRRLAFSTFTKNPDLVLVDLETGRSARIHGLETEALPAFFPDRSRIVFTSRRGGEFDLWVQDLVDGRPDGIPRRLSDQAGTESVPTVSPDGKWLAYSRVLNQERDVWIMPAAGGLPLRFSDHPSVDMQPAWSPDGTRLAFVSDRSGRQQIWVAEVKSGQRISEALHLDSGDAPVSFLWIVEVDGDRPARRLTSGADARCVRWTADSESLWINGSWGNDRLEIRHLRLADGQAMPRSRAVVMPDGPAAGIFDVSADGRFIVHVIEEEPTGDVWLMEAVSGSY